MRWALRIAGLLLLLALLVLAAINTAPGAGVLMRAVASATHGAVRAEGLSGWLPGAPRVSRLELHDEDGVWLVAEAVSVRLDLSALLHATLRVQDVRAGTIQVLRAPKRDDAAAAGPGPLVPVRIVIGQMAVARIVLAPSVAGAPAELALTGSGSLTPLDQGDVRIDLRRLDAPGRYMLEGSVADGAVRAELAFQEPAGGWLAAMAGVAQIGALDGAATLDGPSWRALGLRARLGAGALKAQAQATLDAMAGTGHGQVDLTAPAMAPRPGLSWQAASLHLDVEGSRAAPVLRGTADIAGLAMGAARLHSAHARITTEAGIARLDATLTGLSVPDAPPGLVAAPVQVTATAAVAARSLQFSVDHPLLTLTGHADPHDGAAVLVLPDLAAIGLHGSLRAELQGIWPQLTLEAAATLKDPPALLGAMPRLSVAAALDGANVTLDHARLTGSALTAAADGRMRDGVLALHWQAALADLAAVLPAWQGKAAAEGHLDGPLDALAATAMLTATSGGDHVSADLAMTGLPGHPAGRVSVQGNMSGEALALTARATRAHDNTLKAQIDSFAWHGITAQADATWPVGAILPRGQARVAPRHGRFSVTTATGARSRSPARASRAPASTA